MHHDRLRYAIGIAALAYSLAGTPVEAQQALVSDNPSFCLATNGSLTRCTDQQNLFTRTYEARNAFVFRTSSGCLSGSGGYGNQVRISACNGSIAQDWFVVDDKLIQNKANNFCLDVKDERFAEGNPVILWGCRSKRNQNNQNFALAPIRKAVAGEKAKNLRSIRQAVSDGAISGQTVFDIGGGYVIAAGGGNLIGTSGSNVIAAGGGNLIGTSGSNVIAAGGGNLIGTSGSNVIAAGGGNLIGTSGSNYTTLSVGTAASSGQFSVSGKSNVFAAGRSSVPDVYYGGGELPPQITVAGLKSVTFPSVTGGVGYGGYQGGGHPDGLTDTNYPRTNIDAYQGISGVVHDNRIMFLVGVFLDDGEPSDPAPASLNLTDANADNVIAPGLRQAFFIGDGKTTTGAEQSFMVPAGATRLFLGFADSMGFTGSHAAYGDNGGAIAASFQTYK